MKQLHRLLMVFARLRVAQQLSMAFFIVLSLSAVMGGLAIVGLQRVDSQALALNEKWLQGVGHLAAMRVALIEARDVEVKHSRTADRSYQSEYEEKIAAAAKASSQALRAYEALQKAEGEAALTGQLAKGWRAYESAQAKVIALGKDKKQQDAADISDGLGSTAFDETIAALDALNKFNFDGGRAAADQVEGVYTQARTLIAAMLGTTLVIGTVLAWGITRRLIGQLGGEPLVASNVARAVAEGDLSTVIELKPGDTESLMARLHDMQTGLARAVAAVRQGSESVATSSAQIAQGNQDLSSRTEEQASALEQTSATMEELGTTVRHNADSARQANELAQGASAVAAQGGEVVGKVVKTMQGINDSSRKIGDIISVIDSIAFQTNILALNAAVEAARAGEQGRGFAVVASEVRSLAHRSAEAAKQIKTLIGHSVEQVSQGTALVDQAGKTMAEIVGSIQRVRDIVSEITAASVEQSTGVAHVTEAVGQMDQATQQNAALVEQSAAAAESLKCQAQQLVQAVAVFKLSQEQARWAANEIPEAAMVAAEHRSAARASQAHLAPAKPRSAPAAISSAAPAIQPVSSPPSDDWETF